VHLDAGAVELVLDRGLAVDASIGITARPTRRPTPSSSSGVPVSASRAVVPRSPVSMAARRTASAGRSAARAIASSSTPSSAPVRSSPSTTRVMKSCSRAVARAARSTSAADRCAPEPSPPMAASRSSASSSSSTVSDGSVAGSVDAEASVRQPTPMRPWRGRAIR
jgi:hypothetical protein